MTGLLFGALHIDSVQTFFAHRLTAYLSDELHTKVYIDRVSIRFFKSVVLKGVYVQDLHGDTLLYSEEIVVSVDDISTKEKKLNIGRLSLVNSEFNLTHYKDEAHDNLHFITEYF